MNCLQSCQMLSFHFTEFPSEPCFLSNSLFLTSLIISAANIYNRVCKLWHSPWPQLKWCPHSAACFWVVIKKGTVIQVSPMYSCLDRILNYYSWHRLLLTFHISQRYFYVSLTFCTMLWSHKEAHSLP